MKLDSPISAAITGGASGFGAATARCLAADGVKIAIFDLNGELSEALARELSGVFRKINVASSDEVDAGFAKACAAIGQERILVNCARGRRRGLDRLARQADRRDQGIGCSGSWTSAAKNEWVRRSEIQTEILPTFPCACRMQSAERRVA